MNTGLKTKNKNELKEEENLCRTAELDGNSLFIINTKNIDFES